MPKLTTEKVCDGRTDGGGRGGGAECDGQRAGGRGWGEAAGHCPDLHRGPPHPPSQLRLLWPLPVLACQQSCFVLEIKLFWKIETHNENEKTNNQSLFPFWDKYS